ncbi:NAD-dependent epimerase/dehydratase family protein [Salibacterium aidingense]|uniref:NAD-dependent epimerase/dehydratase family protein n=1 Tax=Salibacterium aidingense TaxID=384933 RepID=UPI003BBA47D4
MNILVLGGTRFFGKALIDILLSEGHQITVATRGNQRPSFLKECSFVKVDRSSLKQMSKAFSGKQFDVIYDQLCFNAADAAISTEVFRGHTGHYIMTSTMAVYPDSRQALFEKDFNPALVSLQGDSEEEQTGYGEGKQLAEAVFAQHASFVTTYVRFPVVLGTSDYTNRLETLVDRIRNETPIGIADTGIKQSFISAEDAARFLAWIKDKPLKGAVNAASQGTITPAQLLNRIGELTKTEPRTTADITVENQYPFPHTTYFMDTTKARKSGFLFEAVEPMIEDTVQNILYR